MNRPGEAARQVIAVGASAGGVEALTALVGGLPADLPAAMLVVLHMPSGGASRLPGILSRHTALPVTAARDGEHPVPGHVYLAVNDRHLLLKQGRILLTAGPKYNKMRPAVDPLFLSAARWYGRHSIGVVLSGALDDGAAGLAAIAAAGGAALVQQSQEALVRAMPHAARTVVPTAVTCPAAAMGAHLSAILRDRRPLPPGTTADRDIAWETDVMQASTSSREPAPGPPVAVSCPDCTGGMNITETGSAVQYWCHVGHGWSPQALLAAQRDKAEHALWTVVSMLEEQAAVHRHLASHAERSNAATVARHQRAAADEAIGAADTIRKVFPDLVSGSAPDAGPADRKFDREETR